jgi:beta-alanine--pyruvate transaminase
METRTLNLEHYWMPFTDNRRFKAKPRLVASAKDMYFTTVEGKQVLDGLANASGAQQCKTDRHSLTS